MNYSYNVSFLIKLIASSVLLFSSMAVMGEENASYICQTLASEKVREFSQQELDAAMPVPLPKIKLDQDLLSELNELRAVGNEPDGIPKKLDSGQKPWKYAGKLFMTTDAGLASCTAQFIDKNLLVTAAHCVFQSVGQRKFYTDIQFYQHYKGTKKSEHFYTPVAVGLMQAYSDAGGNAAAQVTYDYAYIKTAKHSENKEHFKVASPPEEGKEIRSIGYPNDLDNGDHLYGNIGRMYVGKRLNYYLAGPSGMTAGSSGGAWVREGAIRAIHSGMASEVSFEVGPAIYEMGALINYVLNDCSG
ncbi:trypsin-like serine peptidase [Bowmanella dokdonensis]|uniref:Trypsin-like serine protease n=1 Tax=Bowmanella dokdonensis TaxID=751969 RepID=A0A939DS71_9ALTE|nr:trypsin-like serine protease [Bowmanella dokdonensis]MBN7827784.1 trypsin-like serine protease [Bowmanella dokdonensis]